MKPPALTIIDVQKGFDDPRLGRRNNPQAEARVAELLAAWRSRRWPIFHVQHASRFADSPLNPESPGFHFKDEARPLAGEPVIRKNVNCAFIGTDLEKCLRDADLAKIVIVGLTTPHCVSTTARVAANLDFKVTVVSDATAAFDWPGADGRLYPAEQLHEVSLVTLNEEFARIVTAEQLLAAS